ncbi:predicted protein [Chaetomium globosum CBS 148.51]|uniref:Uncharacterized protein n=1 Tax=Chaetomium globosum (strain ATCC 6205 / CBS 148.51 / DSM 1962 / NBRC 6347 / NRRL 1970) TaxID=306901 RepID=Q2H6A4_CHAGB|nr:uncharacterized protein CHGG_05811 [Chaetomium globosum CBS 148.51]EAQ89192.1 predicted protein [Chaetomium globosum CBS 148.51]
MSPQKEGDDPETFTTISSSEADTSELFTIVEARRSRPQPSAAPRQIKCLLRFASGYLHKPLRSVCVNAGVICTLHFVRIYANQLRLLRLVVNANAFLILEVSKSRLRCFFLSTMHVRIELSMLDIDGHDSPMPSRTQTPRISARPSDRAHQPSHKKTRHPGSPTPSFPPQTGFGARALHVAK